MRPRSPLHDGPSSALRELEGAASEQLPARAEQRVAPPFPPAAKRVVNEDVARAGPDHHDRMLVEVDGDVPPGRRQPAEIWTRREPDPGEHRMPREDGSADGREVVVMEVDEADAVATGEDADRRLVDPEA